MNHFDVSKFLFYGVSIAGFLGLVFSFALYSGAKKTVVYTAVRDIKGSIEHSINLVLILVALVLDILYQPTRSRDTHSALNNKVNNLYSWSGKDLSATG